MVASILKKLRYTEGSKAAVINAPEKWARQFSDHDGADITIDNTMSASFDWGVVFVYNQQDVSSLGLKAIESCEDDTIIWFAYPKKSSSIKTDLTRDKGWEEIHNKGWTGVSMVSIDDDWSAFRLRPQGKKRPIGTTSEASVKAATTKNWREWYSELDKNDAKQKNHSEIASILNKKYKLDGWWAQMITNSYEQHIGRREKHQKSDGYEASVSRTLPLQLAEAYRAFSDENIRKDWLQDPEFQISTARENKSIRALWVDGKTRISVEFYEKGGSKTQVVVQHLKIPSSEECEKMKKYWKMNLSRL